MSAWKLGYTKELTRVIIEVEADEVTINEIVQKFNPLVKDVLKKIVREGKMRADGTPVKKPCGCGE